MGQKAGSDFGGWHGPWGSSCSLLPRRRMLFDAQNMRE